MATYTFCHIVEGGYQRWHIREVKPNEKGLFRRPKKNTLCGIPSVRDVDIAITAFYLNNNACSACLKEYLVARHRGQSNGSK